MFNFFKKKVETPKEKVKKREEDFQDIKVIAEYFHKETGITFDKQESILRNKLSHFCRQREICSFEELLQNIHHNKSIKQEIIDHLTTNETYFYRELKQIQELVELVKQETSHVSILCAPSSTGEEPYSIAIALFESGIRPSQFSITGIDINSEAITKAQNAIYGQRNIRNLSDRILSTYFTKENDSYLLKENVKSTVRFKVMNIFDTSFNTIGKYDFVFSRNMLIYFDKATKLKAKEILESVRKEKKHDVFFGHADLF